MRMIGGTEGGDPVINENEVLWFGRTCVPYVRTVSVIVRFAVSEGMWRDVDRHTDMCSYLCRQCVYPY